MSSQLCEVLSFSGSSHLAGVSGAVLGSHGCPCPVHGGLLSSWHLHTLGAPRWSEEGWQGFVGRPLVGCVCFLKDVLGHGVGEEEHRCQGPFHHVLPVSIRSPGSRQLVSTRSPGEVSVRFPAGHSLLPPVRAWLGERRALHSARGVGPSAASSP